jgi:hypothetical protein
VKLIEKQLIEKTNRLNVLELDLEEKNLLINKLLTENKYESAGRLSTGGPVAKDVDLIIEHDVVADSSDELSDNIKSMIRSLEVSHKRSEEKSTFLNEYFALKEEYSQIKCQIQLINNGINKFIEYVCCY